ncbi:hypothetical protein HK102_007277, partial [Quaeritorhiza haematococci]
MLASNTPQPDRDQGDDFAAAFLAPTFDLKAWVNEALSNAARTSVTAASDTPTASTQNLLETDTDQLSSDSAADDRPDESIEAATPLAPTLPSSSNLGAPAPSNLPIDQLASSLVLKLQLLSQDVSQKLDSQSQEAVKSIPRVLADLDLIRKDVQAVRESVERCKQSFAESEPREDGAFHILKQLDMVRTRMDGTRVALKEAENWSTLATEMETIFASYEYERAATRLQEAQRSLVLLQNAPDYEERKALLSKLHNQLEAALSPLLIAALNDYNAEQTRKYYRIFEQVQRTQDFINYYYRCRKAKLVALWQQYDDGGATGRDDFVDWLGHFYEEVFLVLSKEFSWCSFMFPEPKEILLSLIQQIFTSLKPSMNTRLSDLVETHKEQALPIIIKCYQATVLFGQQVERLLLSSPEDSGTSSNRKPALSSHQTSPVATHAGGRSLIKPSLPTEPGSWGFVVFEAFMPFQQDYGTYEKTLLQSHLNTAFKYDTNLDYMEIVRTMGDLLPNLIKFAEAATMRCIQLTDGFGAVGLLEALNAYFVAIIDRYKALLQLVRSETSFGKRSKKQKGGNAAASSSAADLQQHMDDTPLDDYELGSGDLMGNKQQQDWAHFQVGLGLLGICAAMTKRLQAFDENVKKTLSSVVKTRIDLAHTESLTEFVEQQQEHKDECVASLVLLKLSALNSYKLHNLISSIEDSGLSSTAPLPLKTGSGPAGKDSSTSPESRSPTLSETFKSLSTLTTSSQKLVFDILTFPIQKAIAPVPTLEIWASSASTTSSPFNLEMPQFSLSPSGWIMKVGEHLLTLPQQLELYSDDEALGFEVGSLPFLEEEEESEEGKKESGGAGSGDGEGTTAGAAADGATTDGQPLEEPIQPNDQNPTVLHPNSDSEDSDSEDQTAVAHLWLTSISRGTMSHLLTTILKIKNLTPQGRKQLVTDLGYL